MIHLLLTKAATSMKKEMAIIAGVIIGLFFMPIIALISLTDVSALIDSTLKLYSGPASTRNTYIYGFCTFWTAKRREEIGKPIPNNWGDANKWDDGALGALYLVDHIPAVGAIMQTDAGKEGHVAFVEKVNADGSWEVSEMNVKGWDILSSRTFKASEAQNYNFIH